MRVFYFNFPLLPMLVYYVIRYVMVIVLPIVIILFYHMLWYYYVYMLLTYVLFFFLCLHVLIYLLSILTSRVMYILIISTFVRVMYYVHFL